MSGNILAHIYLALTIILTVFSQILIKWRITDKFSGLSLPENLADKLSFLLHLIFDPFIFTGLVATFASGLFWMATMTKLEISYAYPFTSLGFVLVLLFSALLLGESMNIHKILGVFFIMLGIFITSRG